MKTTNLKYFAYALSALMLMQSCKVYHSKTTTVDEAILSQKRVEVKNYSDEIFKFNYLLKDNDQLYGIANRNSTTAKKLSAQIIDDNSVNKFVKIQLPENTINEYRLHNKTLSTIINIAVPIVIVFLTVGFMFDWSGDGMILKE